ncbi:hypothetical protein T484DRAFT_1886822, partial [Baffinella frigidus]
MAGLSPPLTPPQPQRYTSPPVAEQASEVRAIAHSFSPPMSQAQRSTRALEAQYLSPPAPHGGQDFQQYMQTSSSEGEAPAGDLEHILSRSDDLQRRLRSLIQETNQFFPLQAGSGDFAPQHPDQATPSSASAKGGDAGQAGYMEEEADWTMEGGGDGIGAQGGGGGGEDAGGVGKRLRFTGPKRSKAPSLAPVREGRNENLPVTPEQSAEGRRLVSPESSAEGRRLPTLSPAPHPDASPPQRDPAASSSGLFSATRDPHPDAHPDAHPEEAHGNALHPQGSHTYPPHQDADPRAHPEGAQGNAMQPGGSQTYAGYRHGSPPAPLQDAHRGGAQQHENRGRLPEGWTPLERHRA